MKKKFGKLETPKKKERPKKIKSNKAVMKTFSRGK